MGYHIFTILGSVVTSTIAVGLVYEVLIILGVLKGVYAQAAGMFARLAHELLPIGVGIYWVHFVYSAFQHNAAMEVMSGFCAAIWTWILLRGPDDRWRRRYRKAKEKVVEVAGRLVVRPSAEPA